MSLRHFLLVFDHRLGRLVGPPREFRNADEAITAYSQTERMYEKDESMEIVLIGSDSLDTIRETHANYFDGTAARSKFLAGL